MKTLFLLVASLLSIDTGVHAQLREVVPQQMPAAADGFGSPGLDAGDYVYVSGQGPRRQDGNVPTNFADQVRQSLQNLRSVIEAAGLTMDHVVYVQVYLEDMHHYGELNKVFADYFAKNPPARAVLGVSRLPVSPVQINAVAVRDLAGRRPVNPPNFKPDKAYSPGMLTHDRLFVSTMLGSDPSSGKVPEDPAAQVDVALDGLKSVVEAAGLKLSNMVFVNPYLTREVPMQVMNERYARRFEFGNTPARATIEVSSLPEGVHIAYTGVAVRDLSQRRAVRPKNMPPSPTASPCVFAGNTLYCSAKSGFIPGPNGGIYASTTSQQVRQTMRNLLDNLEEADMKFDQVISTTVYLDDLSELPEFEKVYKQYFKGIPPAQTTVQQVESVERKSDEEGEYPTLEQVSLIAVRK
ncbi:MAG TPA: RidA family protein [Terriglobales bacterium]|nr:RidA family protein [Terriglobales bacterium]